MIVNIFCMRECVFLWVLDECEYLLTTVEIPRPTAGLTDCRDTQSGASGRSYDQQLITKPHGQHRHTPSPCSSQNNPRHVWENRTHLTGLEHWIILNCTCWCITVSSTYMWLLHILHILYCFVLWMERWRTQDVPLALEWWATSSVGVKERCTTSLWPFFLIFHQFGHILPFISFLNWKLCH